MSKVEEVIKSPLDLVEELAITQNMRQNVSQHQNEMKAVLDGRDQRLVILAGPCSIHNISAAMEYAERLKKLEKAMRAARIAGAASAFLPAGTIPFLSGR